MQLQLRKSTPIISHYRLSQAEATGKETALGLASTIPSPFLAWKLTFYITESTLRNHHRDLISR